MSVPVNRRRDCRQLSVGTVSHIHESLTESTFVIGRHQLLQIPLLPQQNPIGTPLRRSCCTPVVAPWEKFVECRISFGFTVTIQKPGTAALIANQLLTSAVAGGRQVKERLPTVTDTASAGINTAACKYSQCNSEPFGSEYSGSQTRFRPPVPVGTVSVQKKHPRAAHGFGRSSVNSILAATFYVEPRGECPKDRVRTALPSLALSDRTTSQVAVFPATPVMTPESQICDRCNPDFLRSLPHTDYQLVSRGSSV